MTAMLEQEQEEIPWHQRLGRDQKEGSGYKRLKQEEKDPPHQRLGGEQEEDSWHKRLE